MSAVWRVIRAAARAHRLPSILITLVVLASTATSVISIALLAAADAPFDRAFARAHGAHATVTFDATKATVPAIAATARRPDVTAAGGPYQLLTLGLSARGVRLPEATVVGRDRPNGPLDTLTLEQGRWPRGPGEIAVSTSFGGRHSVGQQLSTDDPAAPVLTVVGLARSITQTADGWVTPAQAHVLQPQPSTFQMQYRFRSSKTDTGIHAALARTVAGLAPSAVLGASSYLAVRLGVQQSSATAVPFVTSFAVLGLVMSALIVGNVVSGAVIAGYRRVGILKALGFTPAQVVLVFAGRALLPTLLGCLGGAGVGASLAWPILNQQGAAYQVGNVGVPVWAVAVSVVAMLAIVAAAAGLPALRAARFSATQALSVGRTPTHGRGGLGRRIHARSGLPRPLALGLAAPLVRPGRSVATGVTILLGACSLVFAVGLTSSLTRVAGGLTRAAAAPVRVDLTQGSAAGSTPTQVAALIESTPGTAHVVGVREATVNLLAGSHGVDVTGYDGPSSWVGYPLVSGRWIEAAGEAVVPTYIMRLAGVGVGGSITLDAGNRRQRLRVVGQIFDLDNGGLSVVTTSDVVRNLDPTSGVDHLEVGLLPHTDVSSYLRSVDQQLPRTSGLAWRQGSDDNTISLFLILIKAMMLLIGSVVAIGVFNATVLSTREQVREIGILKAIGMTPAQVSSLVLTSVFLLGVITSVVALPIGLQLHREVLSDMARIAATALPTRYLRVYSWAGLAATSAAATLIALVGASVPAAWAARARAAASLRAE